jgi:predicted Zn finger-like uncharacterized protein
MRIACPFCSAAYDVPETLIRDRRTVRCAQCFREWSVGPVAGGPGRDLPQVQAAAEASAPKEPPPLPVPQAAPAAAVTLLTQPPPALAATAKADPRPPPVQPPDPGVYQPTATERLITESDPPQPGPPVWAAWAASIALLFLLCWAAYAWRSDVMDVWPPSQRLYAALGLKSTPE